MKILTPVLRTLFVCGAFSSLVACSIAENELAAPFDSRLKHPIAVGHEQVSVTINLPTNGTALSRSDSPRLRRFIRDFVGRGRGPVMVESKRASHAQKVLESQGLRSNEIIVIAGTTLPANLATLTFTANVAQVPNCGKWADETARSGSNTAQPNFGCANRRNVGLTVADPGDLIRSQPMSGRGAARRDGVIDGYNDGDNIGPKTAPIDTQSVSGVN